MFGVQAVIVESNVVSSCYRCQSFHRLNWDLGIVITVLSDVSLYHIKHELTWIKLRAINREINNRHSKHGENVF